MAERRRVLFVCTGNICRSAMAEAIARNRFGGPTVGFESAGTRALAGEPPTPVAVEACGEIGVTMSGQRARQFDPGRVREFDRIYVMTAAHRDAVLAAAPAASDRVHLLRADGGDIDDPYGSDLATYRATRDEIAAAIDERGPDL